MSELMKLAVLCPALIQVSGEDEKLDKEVLQDLCAFTENLIRCVYAFEGIKEDPECTQISRLNTLSNRGFLPQALLPFFYVFDSNRSTDAPDAVLKMKVNLLISLADRLAKWFIKIYLPHLPEDSSSVSDTNNLILKIYNSPYPDPIKRSVRKSSVRFANTMQLSEKETRVIIDFQLEAVGWQADSIGLRYSQGTRPEKGANKAISEWPGDTGQMDYALFAGLDLIGVIEAKKMGKDILSDLIQSKRYSKTAKLDAQAKFIGGPWEDYKVPFLFSTNARPYLEQLKEKSGIWFLDSRRSTNHPKPLQGWYSAKELISLYKQDIQKAHKKLKCEPMNYLSLRDYQEKAIAAVEKALDKSQKNVLIAMATGTGKTRIALGLIYRLIKSERFRRILFIVDRTSLGEQAGDKFKETRLEDLKTLDQIYDLKEVNESGIEQTTKVKISTVQALMHAIMYPSSASEIPNVGQYDCIIVDEAHRGYTLDRELGDDSLPYRDQNDYLSKYRRVIEFFDAVKIGLTATPAPHTIEIFGKPVFTYSYREAVIDGWLIDHEPPHQIVTHLAKEGIKWEKGDTIPVYDPSTGQITNIEDIPDEVKIEIDHFNKLVLTENFNSAVAKDLVKYLNPDGEEKTLIFAASDDHADMVVRILKEEFENSGVPIDDDTIVKITGSIDRPEGMIRRFKNERMPNIAVTVDLLTTGIDVPEICNLVFIRRIRSRILFEQMIGRATRRCDRIKKNHFNIYDTVALYNALEPVSGMQAVAADPSISLDQLIDELADMEANNEKPEILKKQLEQIHARLQRILRRLDKDALEGWKSISGGQSFDQFINSLDLNEPNEYHKKLIEKRTHLLFLDENKYRPRKQLISNHDDELHSHTRGYGEAKAPGDYLNSFSEFIINNMNKIPALAIVCQRPRELTRTALKELKLALDQAGYTEKNLQVAWKDWKNEDIAADIISFIRRQALGDPLVSHEVRIHSAMEKIFLMHAWTEIQRQWLERIEKQLIAQTILDKEDFNRGAFRNFGGISRLNKIFKGNFDKVLEDINKNLYPEERKTA